jgi:hypothetical protein
MRALEAKANPPSPAAQAIAPFFKGGWKDTAHFPLIEEDAAPFPLVEEDAALFPLDEKRCRTGAALIITRIGGGKVAGLLTPFEKGGRHRAAMTGGFALRAPLANSAT